MSSFSVSSSSSSSSSFSSFITGSKNPDKDFKKPKKIAVCSSLPADLPEKAPQHESPWHISTPLFKRLKFEPGATEAYHKVAVTQEDPEWAFVHTYFNHSPPKNRRIQAVYCLHNPTLTRQFEALLPTLEQEAHNPFYAPTWDKGSDVLLRKKTIQRWQEAANLFSPFSCYLNDREKRQLTHVKILPLWHGTKEEVCDSVAKTGFAFFGTHDYDKGGLGDGSSTDIGFFGNGMYFTNSARYSVHYAPKTTTQHTMLAWVSMREPYPVVSDRDSLSEEEEPADKTLLKGKGPYKKHNAHYIPVAPIPGTSKKKVYYPCPLKRAPWWDEIVVFQKAQTLPRFWVQLAVDLPYSPSSMPAPSSSSSMSMYSSSLPSFTVGTLLRELPKLLVKPALKKQEQATLYLLLKKQYQSLLTVNPLTLLSSSQLAIYNSLPFLLDHSGTINDFAAESLLEILEPLAASKASLSFASADSPLLEDFSSFVISPKKEKDKKENKYGYEPLSLAPTLSSPKAPAVPAAAFGKAAWEKYFGEVGEEPPLPSDIATILSSPCPIWPSKQVRETHLLVLVPATVNGKKLTLQSLGELVKSPKEGHKTQYRAWYPGGNEKASLEKNTWVLLTRDVLPGSRNQPYDKQVALVGELAKKAGASYAVPRIIEVATSLFMHHVRNGERLYTDSPWTYTRCQEKYDGQWPLACGGFSASGVHVSYYVFYDSCYVLEDLGVGAVRKF